MCGGPTPLAQTLNEAACKRRERTRFCDRHTVCNGHSAAYWRHEPYCNPCRSKMATARKTAADRKKHIQESNRDRYEKRKDAGLCQRCNLTVPDVNPQTGKPYLLCPDCRAKQGVSKQSLALRRRAAGLCKHCGDPVREINRNTGKPYHDCAICRARIRDRQRMRESRRSGRE